MLRRNLALAALGLLAAAMPALAYPPSPVGREASPRELNDGKDQAPAAKPETRDNSRLTERQIRERDVREAHRQGVPNQAPGHVEDRHSQGSRPESRAAVRGSVPPKEPTKG